MGSGTSKSSNNSASNNNNASNNSASNSGQNGSGNVGYGSTPNSAMMSPSYPSSPPFSPSNFSSNSGGSTQMAAAGLASPPAASAVSSSGSWNPEGMVEDFMEGVNCSEHKGWKKLKAQNDLEVFARISDVDREICVRFKCVTQTTPSLVCKELWSFEKRAQWDNFFKNGTILSEDSTSRLSAGEHGLIPYSDKPVTLQQVLVIHGDGTYFVVEKMLGRNPLDHYELLSGFCIQRLSASSSMLISAFRFQASKVLPSVLHSMSNSDAAGFFIEKFTPTVRNIPILLKDAQNPATTPNSRKPFGSPKSGGAAVSTETASAIANLAATTTLSNYGSEGGDSSGGSSNPPDSFDGDRHPKNLEDFKKMALMQLQQQEGENSKKKSDQGGSKNKNKNSNNNNGGGGDDGRSGAKTSTVLRWKRGELIGSGAIGKVYLALNEDTGQLMAVKQVSFINGAQQQDQLRSLEQEVELFTQLKHPNIIEYLGVERSNEGVSIFLEYVSGGSLQSLLKKFGAFKEPIIRSYTRQIVSGLAYLHSKTVCHRDIKAANILCTNDGVVKLADFGASKKIADICNFSTGLRSLVGTPYMMAPEVIKQTGHGMKADIWSLGCVVIEMATAVPPWSQFKDRMAAMFHIANAKGPPELPDTLSYDVVEFITLCMAVDPKRRPSAEDLLHHRMVAESSSSSTPLSAASQAISPSGGGSSSSASMNTNINNNNNNNNNNSPAFRNSPFYISSDKSRKPNNAAAAANTPTSSNNNTNNNNNAGDGFLPSIFSDQPQQKTSPKDSPSSSMSKSKSFTRLEPLDPKQRASSVTTNTSSSSSSSNGKAATSISSNKKGAIGGKGFPSTLNIGKRHVGSTEEEEDDDDDFDDSSSGDLESDHEEDTSIIAKKRSIPGPQLLQISVGTPKSQQYQSPNSFNLVRKVTTRPSPMSRTPQHLQQQQQQQQYQGSPSRMGNIQHYQNDGSSSESSDDDDDDDAPRSGNNNRMPMHSSGKKTPSTPSNPSWNAEYMVKRKDAVGTSGKSSSSNNNNSSDDDRH